MSILITGGAGFIGSNLANYFLSQGEEVIIFDNLSRPGVELNLKWLQATHGDNRLTYVPGDIRSAEDLKEPVARANTIYHLAGQVAVTTSVTNPVHDFEVNALGTLNVLEAARLSGHKPTLIFTSTNKVYGGMENIAIAESENRYSYRDFPNGIDENHPLDFHSPYGCSKGAADQYVRGYRRIYDLPTVVFRMSCIYGPRQFGTEDQGWVAYFVIASLMGWPVTIYGDGKQIRDILYIDDLVRAFDLARQHISVTAGQVYNIGGGASNTIAIWSEFGPLLNRLSNKVMLVDHKDWRPGDQKVYVSDHSKATRAFGWRPEVSSHEGIERLMDWVKSNLDLF
ncbi:MAG: NAD-dependent epimerase/dehydratase family protein, partial [Nitrosomonas sp. PRO5]|nr:NAD-dependent epimerase/dehydratase family protein [Nitrosomonas sp. PRO5]